MINERWQAGNKIITTHVLRHSSSDNDSSYLFDLVYLCLAHLARFDVPIADFSNQLNQRNTVVSAMYSGIQTVGRYLRRCPVP